VTRSGRRFDVILDVGGYASLPLLNRSLAPGGTAVLVGAGNVARVAARLVAAKVRSRLLGQRLIFFLARITRDDLLVLADLAAAGKIVPVIDRTYPLREAPEAVRYFGTGQAGGKVVITV
jgi:Zn-dependent alcohol dehydrogenases